MDLHEGLDYLHKQHIQLLTILTYEQAFPEIRRLSRDLAKWHTVLCCKHGATGDLGELVTTEK